MARSCLVRVQDHEDAEELIWCMVSNLKVYFSAIREMNQLPSESVEVWLCELGAHLVELALRYENLYGEELREWQQALAARSDEL